MNMSVPDSTIKAEEVDNDYRLLRERLQQNYHLYRKLKESGSPCKPVGISIAITGRCNSHCIMCNIWKLSHQNPGMVREEMSIEEILSYLGDPYLSDLVEVDLTGGEPHLRDDLVELVCAIADLKKSKLPKLRTIIIPSNGFLTDKILTRTEQILKYLDGIGIDFVSVSSLDGIGKTHDIIRGTAGAYEWANKTIEGLLAIREQYGEIYLPGIKTTITHANVDELDKLLDFAQERKIFYIISAVIISKMRFRNEQNRENLELRNDDLNKIAEFYKKRQEDIDFYYEKIFESITSGKKQWVCTALFNYVFIDYDRKVYPCPIQDVCVGDLSSNTMSEILNSERAKYIRKKIGTYNLCQYCTEPGSVRYSQIFEGGNLLDFIEKKGRDKYHEIIFDKGLNKLLYI